MKTKFIYSEFPNLMQWGDGPWDGHLFTKNLSLTDAKKLAESNNEVTFFSQTTGMVVLSSGKNRKQFFPKDNAFFKGDFVFGTAPGLANSYAIAEAYDTSDEATRLELLGKISKIKIGSGVKTDGGTKANPVKITAGFVFCDFPDVQGASIDNDFITLIGANNELVNFIKNESKETAELTLERFDKVGKDQTPGTWVRLPSNYSNYENDTAKLKNDIDTKIEFPDNWDVVFFAFPNKLSGDPGTFFKASSQDANRAMVISQCSNGSTVDTNQKVNVIYLDPMVYRENRPEAITVHEMGHALGLPDLYNAALNRSYGWSLMSDTRNGWHLTGFEKLVLGWESMDNYIFLKRGIIQTAIKAQSQSNGVKGIIILPDDNESDDCYFMEVAQVIGGNVDARNNWANEGLLVMVAQLNSNQGCISPFVNKYVRGGGASQAPFLADSRLNTNGIFSHSITGYDRSKNELTCIIGIDRKNSDRAVKLRENESLVLDKTKFTLDISGKLKFNNHPCFVNGNYAQKAADLKDKDYGFCAYVDNKGVFHLATSVDDKPAPAMIIKTFPVPSGVFLPEANYFFKLSITNNLPVVAIYQGQPEDVNPIFKYNVLYAPYGFASGWSISSGNFTLCLQGDGNLTLSESGAWKWGTKNVGTTKDKNLDFIHLKDDGAMNWFDSDGNILKSWAASGGAGPFSLGLDTSTNVVKLQVKDKDGNVKYSINLDATI